MKYCIVDESYRLIKGKPYPADASAFMRLPCARGAEVCFQILVNHDAAYAVQLNRSPMISRRGSVDTLRIAVDSPYDVTLSPVGLLKDDDNIEKSDVLLKSDYAEAEANESLLIHARLQVPADAAAGEQKVTLRFYQGNMFEDEKALEGTLQLTLRIYDVAMPGKDAFLLDLWQHSSNVARKYDVNLWSDEHFAVLEKVIASLAELGQKCVTVIASEVPWCGQSCSDSKTDNLFEYSMISTTKKADGTFVYDYTAMRRYISLCEKYGTAQEIDIYGLTGVWVKPELGFPVLAEDYPDGMRIRYYDEADGCYKYMRKAFEIDAFIVALMEYFRTEGLADRVRFAADEPADVEKFRSTISHLKELCPDAKLKTAIGHAEFIDEFKDAIDVFSPFIYCVVKEFDNIKAKQAELTEKTFIWYVCCAPHYINTFLRSFLLESRYIGILTAYMGFVGFLRWNYCIWPEEPRRDIRYGIFPAGDVNFIYPAGNGDVLLSQRYMLLKRGIEDFCLIDQLRKAGREDVVNAAMAQVIREPDVRTYSTLLELEKNRPAQELCSDRACDYHRMREMLLMALETLQK